MLNKETYKIAFNRKELPKIVNGNLLKKYYRRLHYKSVIIIESDINREHIGIGILRINILTTEQILEKISKNVKKGSKWNKRNYYRLRRRIEKLNERVDMYILRAKGFCMSNILVL